MFLVAAALVTSYLITISEIALTIVDMLQPFMGNQTLLLIAIMVLVVIVTSARSPGRRPAKRSRA
jgi:TRAP-type transport system large permease protein